MDGGLCVVCLLCWSHLTDRRETNECHSCITRFHDIKSFTLRDKEVVM